MNLKNFWYIVGEGKKLKKDKVLSACVLDMWLVVYRDDRGQVVVAEDRCLHRNARLSSGSCNDGVLQCPYHGWRYGRGAQVIAVPSEGSAYQPKANMCLRSFSSIEKDGYIYVCLEPSEEQGRGLAFPYDIPFLHTEKYQHVRLLHLFEAEVPNCAENFIDIPHTSFVHPNVFRYQRNPQRLSAEVEMSEANVHVRYRNETSNFGIFSKFLNRADSEIFHEDHYYLPNFTHVEYRFAERGHFNICSQSVPVSNNRTAVYTDLTYDYGIWNFIARPFVYLTAKIIIGQDVRIMKQQTEVTRHFGEQFLSTKADLQHILIERIYAALREGKDPRLMSAKKEVVDFWI